MVSKCLFLTICRARCVLYMFEQACGPWRSRVWTNILEWDAFRVFTILCASCIVLCISDSSADFIVCKGVWRSKPSNNLVKVLKRVSAMSVIEFCLRLAWHVLRHIARRLQYWPNWLLDHAVHVVHVISVACYMCTAYFSMLCVLGMVAGTNCNMALILVSSSHACDCSGALKHILCALSCLQVFFFCYLAGLNDCICGRCLTRHEEAKIAFAKPVVELVLEGGDWGTRVVNPVNGTECLDTSVGLYHVFTIWSLEAYVWCSKQVLCERKVNSWTFLSLRSQLVFESWGCLGCWQIPNKSH